MFQEVYTCEDCDKKFDENDKVEEHIKAKTNIKKVTNRNHGDFRLREYKSECLGVFMECDLYTSDKNHPLLHWTGQPCPEFPDE